MKKKKILITGVAGFIGSIFFKYLKKRGYEVYGVDFNIIHNNDKEIFYINLIDYEKKKNYLTKLVQNLSFT